MKRLLKTALRRSWLAVAIVSVLAVGFAATTQTASAHENRVYRNIQRVSNHHDYLLKVRGRVQLNRPGKHTATLVDTATAYSSCYRCNSFAVALQVNLIDPRATGDRLDVESTAVNFQCVECTTEAIAMQMNVITSDTGHIPQAAIWAMIRMNRELNYMSAHPHMSLTEAENRIAGVIAEFQALSQVSWNKTHSYSSPGAHGESPANDD